MNDKAVYLTIRDSRNRKRTRCCTIYGVTPAVLYRIIREAIKHQDTQRKAG